MASWLELTERLDAGLHGDDRLTVGGMYRPAELPGWLRAPWKETVADAQDGNRTPVLLLNCKGDRPDDVVCLVRLADLERLTANEPERT